MALDRWIALVILTICLIYGFAAFFTMDQFIPPIMRNDPILISTFPKMLACAGVVLALIVACGGRLAGIILAGVLAVLWALVASGADTWVVDTARAMVPGWEPHPRAAASLREAFFGKAEMTPIHTGLAIAMAGMIALAVMGGEASQTEPKEGEIDYRRLFSYNMGQAGALIGLMIAYAFLLRPLGFLLSTSLFIILGSLVLGERRLLAVVLSGLIAAMVIWFLVQVLLGIYLLPLPEPFGDLNRSFSQAIETGWESFLDLFASAEEASQ